MRYPCITPLSTDWNNISYYSKVEIENNNVTTEHILECSGTNSSEIFNLIDQQYIKYVTEIRSPRTLYSESYSDFMPKHECKIDINNIGIEYYIIPTLCAVKDFKLSTNELSKVWRKRYGKTIFIRQGTIIGKSEPWVDRDKLKSLLRFEIYPDVENIPPICKDNGVIKVEHHDGDTPFVAYINKATMQAINQPENMVSKQIERVAIVGILAKLHSMANKEGENIEESEIQSIDRRILEYMENELRKAGVPIWDEDNFDATLAGTAIAPCLLYGDL